MTRTLLLLRHAKSDWTDPSLGDHDRPLADRGLNAAPRMGRYLAENGLIPDQVLCSTAKRAQDTWMLIAAAFVRAGHPIPAPEVSRALYMAEPKTFKDLIKAVPEAAKTLCLVGHNPGLEMFAAKLAKESAADEAALAEMPQNFPTASLAVFRAETAGWDAVTKGRFRLDRFITARSLKD